MKIDRDDRFQRRTLTTETAIPTARARPLIRKQFGHRKDRSSIEH